MFSHCFDQTFSYRLSSAFELIYNRRHPDTIDLVDPTKFHLQKGCLFLDDMGLGKTLTVCKFLYAQLFILQKSSMKKVLVIAPISVCMTWAKNAVEASFRLGNVILYTEITSFRKFMKWRSDDNVKIIIMGHHR